MADPETKMQRENRYLVLKRKELDLLSDEAKRELENIVFALGIAKSKGFDAPATGETNCVVVEHDWPMYETVWRMIEDWDNKQTKSKIPDNTITVRSAITGERRVKVDFALISKRFFSCFGQIDVTTITQEEWLGILSEIGQLHSRLEIDDTGYDGIAARDATIEAQQKVIDELREERDLLKDENSVLSRKMQGVEIKAFCDGRFLAEQQVVRLLNDCKRLLEFSAMAGVSWINDDIEIITSAFNALPEYLQEDINELEQELLKGKENGD